MEFKLAFFILYNYFKFLRKQRIFVDFPIYLLKKDCCRLSYLQILRRPNTLTLYIILNVLSFKKNFCICIKGDNG